MKNYSITGLIVTLKDPEEKTDEEQEFEDWEALNSIGDIDFNY